MPDTVNQVGTLRNFYAGREYDDFTGLYNNRARWYDPQAARFISQDPISFAGGDTNLYRYAGNSPDNATDPSGNFIPLIVWAGFAVAGVGVGVTNYYANEADIATGGNGYIPGLTEDRGAVRQIDQERYLNAMAGVGAGLAITGLGASLIAAPVLGAALGSSSTFLAADGALFGGLYGSTNAYAQGADGWGIATAGATHAAFGAVLGPTLGFAGRVASPYIGRAGAYAGEQLLVGASRVAPKTTQSLALSSKLYVNAYRYGLNSSAGAYSAAQGRFFIAPSALARSQSIQRVTNSAAAPVTGSQWYEALSSRYGATNVTWSRVPSYAGKKTQGVLSTSAGEIDLVSGYAGPSQFLPKGTRGMHGNIKSHVEAHAAALMRQHGFEEATLYINRVPCLTRNPRSPGCFDNLPKMLPEGARLRVRGPDGFDHTFTGLTD